MSGSMAPDPPVRTARRGHYLRFGLIIGIGLISVNSGGRRMAGQSKRRDEPLEFCECGLPFVELSNGSRMCGNDHYAPAGQEEQEKGKGKKGK